MEKQVFANVYVSEELFNWLMDDYQNKVITSLDYFKDTAKFDYASATKGDHLVIQSLDEYLVTACIEPIFTWIERFKRADKDEVSKLIKDYIHQDWMPVTNLLFSTSLVKSEELPIGILKQLVDACSGEDLSNHKCLYVDMSSFVFTPEGSLEHAETN